MQEDNNDRHHIPAAFQTPRPVPDPIALAQRPANSRAAEPSESTRQRWARMARISDNARDEGHADGLRTGYRQGWRWGLVCGATLGAVLASIGWAVWLTVTAGQP